MLHLPQVISLLSVKSRTFRQLLTRKIRQGYKGEIVVIPIPNDVFTVSYIFIISSQESTSLGHKVCVTLENVKKAGALCINAVQYSISLEMHLQWKSGKSGSPHYRVKVTCLKCWFFCIVLSICMNQFNSVSMFKDILPPESCLKSAYDRFVIAHWTTARGLFTAKLEVSTR